MLDGMERTPSSIRPAVRGLRATMARIARAGLAALGFMVALSGCTLGLPMQATPPSAGARGDDVLQVSLTYAVLDRERREPFDRYTRRIVEVLPTQPGLVSFSVRRQLFGSEVWTFTAWESDEARQRFFASGLHLEGIRTAGSAIVELNTKRLALRRDELPRDWDAVLRLWREADSRTPAATDAAR